MDKIKGGINKVTFKSQGAMLAGLLFTPTKFNASIKYPTIMFSGPYNQVKEQMGTKYGKKMAEKGFVFLAFDHLGYGDSEGEPRNSENPFIKMENIRNAISYLRTLPFVDRDKLYGVGSCASGGYVPLVAVTDKRLVAIATVSGMLDNQASNLGVIPKEQQMAMFKMANEARQREYETGKVEYFDALGLDSVDPKKVQPESLLAEGYDYYMTARAGPQTCPNFNHHTVKTWFEVAPLTSAALWAPYLNTPYLGIYGEKAKADTGPLTLSFYEKATEPKELFEVPGATHIALYDMDEYVDQAVAKMTEFFNKY